MVRSPGSYAATSRGSGNTFMNRTPDEEFGRFDWRKRQSQGERRSPIDDRHRPRPTCRGALDLGWEARDGEAGRWQRLEVVQFLDMAIADVTAGLMTFPDERGVVRLAVALRRMDEGRVPAPAVRSSHPNALSQKMQGSLGAYSAA